MSAGRLRDLVSFQYLDENGDDGAGNIKQAGVDRIADIPAEIKPERTKERIDLSGEAGVTGFTLRVRWQPDLAAITIKDRVLDTRNSRVFKMTGHPINRDMRKRYLEISVVLAD